MLGSGKLAALFSDVRRVAGGPGEGLKIVPLEGDREIARGTYEAPVQAAVLANIEPGGVVYDIGANVGFFSLLAARQVGLEGSVYAFEPVPRNAAAIERSARLNGFSNLEVFALAAGAAGGIEDLNLARHIGGAVLAAIGAPPDRNGSVPVEVVAIDEFIPARSLRPPSLVKIDVEGAELAVLRGMSATLRAHQPILICELDDAAEAGLAAKLADLAALLGNAGYALERLDPSYRDIPWQVAHLVARPNRQ